MTEIPEELVLQKMGIKPGKNMITLCEEIDEQTITLRDKDYQLLFELFQKTK